MEHEKNWKIIKSSTGSNMRIYTKNCELCGNWYEGRGARFCGKKCATKWGRKVKDYSNAKFKHGEDNPNFGGLSQEVKQKLSEITKKRWKDGGFVNCQFGRNETKLENKVKNILSELGYEYKQYYWLNKNDWNSKEYDFYIKEFNLLIEVDGAYWHSLPENIENDKYKTEFAKVMGYNLIRIPEGYINVSYIKNKIAELQN